MNKTLLVIIDGLRSDALEKAHVPTLDYLVKHGSSSLAVKTVNPSITLPSHFSIFTSLAPYSHGVMTNTALPDTSVLNQSLFCHIKTLSGTVSSFYSWEHLRNLALPGIMDYAFFQHLTSEKDLVLLAGAASAHIITRKPDFCFVYFGWTDIIGHESGWMSTEYLKALEMTDHALGRIVDSIHSAPGLESYNLIILSDHGGKEKHHIENCPEITNVPFIACGGNIREDYRIDASISLLDIAPTIARLLDIPPHFAWKGKELSNIFINQLTENNELIEKKLSPKPLIHPSSTVINGSFGEYTEVEAGSFCNKIVLGDYSYLSTSVRAIFCDIGKFTSMAQFSSSVDASS